VIVIDTSAVVAFLQGEPEAAAIRREIVRASTCLISAVNLFECRIVISRRHGSHGLFELNSLIAAVDVEIEPFDAEQSMVAFDAYRRFGRGSGHPAQLNLSDCAAYALARLRDAPLLFKGKDFRATDIRDALAG